MIDDANIAAIASDALLRSYVSIDSVNGHVQISLGRETPFGPPAMLTIALEPPEFVDLIRQVATYATRTSTAAICLSDASV